MYLIVFFSYGVIDMARRTLEQFIRNLRRGVGSSFDKKFMKSLGELAIKQIVTRTKKGSGVNRTGGDARRLKPLSESYIQHRVRNRFRLDPSTSPRRSNLTFTGQLLRSMRVKEVSKRKVVWGPNKRRRRGGLTNERLGEIVAEKGRPFNNLSKTDIQILVKRIDKMLNQKLKRI